ncbi:response regulator transcription factor [Dyella japonica]|uniref:LuxR family transcriptional regulator n=1 Tax=Dyella japonica DSM 16301 TaxID=1440762 RepID=A0A0G9H4T4_9GAMM|nr:response regulator transcription factor [Dyella japonica]KLD64588.1 hypothetical protein Y882_06915 [Dyella japonica DSM 16301]
MPFTVFLVDDHPIVRHCLRAEVDYIGATVVGEASSADELLAFLSQHSCDVLVTDFNMPASTSQDGLAMLDAVRRLQPDLPVLVLTMLANPGLLLAIHDRGVAGLVSKSDGLDEIRMALLALAADEKYVSAKVRSLLNALPRQPGSTNTAQLTALEAEILRLFIEGMTVSEIAAQRQRSVKTISHQKISAMNKLGLKNDPELYAFANKGGLAG